MNPVTPPESRADERTRGKYPVRTLHRLALPEPAPPPMTVSITTDGPIYKTYSAENPGYSVETFACAERTVTRLLQQQTTSEHPGMLLGQVQSGKTRTFISVMALAFDNGFDIVIVLSKNSRALIQQTVKRLKSEFRTANAEGDIEIYDIMEAPASFNAFELGAKLTFAAKKETNNLRRLTKLFADNPAMAAKRTLIIDDEADNASIGYSRKDGEIEANKIAKQISDLRATIAQCSFLQVTATPYSLYLQPVDITTGSGFSFKPVRPAFTELVPVPAEYVGGVTYFGDASRSEAPTVESLIHCVVDMAEFDRLKKPDGRSLKLADVLTSQAIRGYREALVLFIVGGCIQRSVGLAQGKKEKTVRYSFLLHSEAGKGAHEWQEEITREIVDQMRDAVSSAPGLLEEIVAHAYEDLSASLKLAGATPPPLNTVVALVREALVGEYINICKVNSDDDVATMLDDTGQLKLRTPLNIFLGGQVLDRGVTLANLIGFYYGRRPNRFQQDTVLQHSRMYGYRRPDLGVTRFHTAPKIRSAMAKMEEFDSALRAAVAAGGDRAVQFIRQAADGSVIPCSPNKILIAATQTLRPFVRLLPIGFQSGYRTGKDGIGATVEELDRRVESLCGFNRETPVRVRVEEVLELLRLIEDTIRFEDEDAPEFDWRAAYAALVHLSSVVARAEHRGTVLLWAARDRNSSRKAGEGSHAIYIESPDSDKTEGKMAREHAKDSPIVFLLRQNGSAEKGWRDAPFYWPVIRAQERTPTAVFTSDTIG